MFTKFLSFLEPNPMAQKFMFACHPSSSCTMWNFQVRDEIEHLMDDDDDMAEMYLTEKKQRSDAYSSDQYGQMDFSGGTRSGSKSEPASPVGLLTGPHKLQRAFSSIVSSSRHSSMLSSSSSGENIDQLEMLLEAYFVVIDNTLSKLSSVRLPFV